ncbi:unnamed protein product [Acanthosepion pharaonis]|uniref:DUF4455 domain-containing protein n=1 Tax=Acanthosepion pharaonis TaxID=158019 RepID=A0A812API2_ACAPH|nr:unnamed protein product [Sepia pharaonis]
MFEAQALLHHQLVQPKSQNTAVVKKGLPIIDTSREASAQGLLNSRQKNWLNGLPFDIYTENPVLYKQHADYIQAKKKKNQYPPEKSMVQALPETVASKPHSSNIVERIETSRHMRHDAALEDLSHELNIIASKLENLIEEATQTLFQQLEEDDKEIEDLLSLIETDEDILQFNYKRLENLWYQIQERLPQRQNYMQQLDEKFSKVEEIRSVQVQQLFLKYLQMFEKIAYKSKSEIQRMMDNIAQMINQTLLNNRLNYTNIYFQLMIADTEREKKQHIYWKTRVEFWKDVNIHRFLEQFRDYLCSSEVINPPVIEELKEKMVAEHTSLNNQYKELLNALRNLYPPKCLPRLFEQWYEQTQVVSRGMYETAGIYVLELEKENEVAIKSCTEKFEETKLLLIMNQLCCSDKAATLMEEFSPMIKEIEMNFIGSMVELKMDLDKQFEHSNQLIADIYIFLQSVAKLWQTHETGLGQQEEMLHESLQEHRCWHNEQNQKREDKLDSILDEMRQGDNEGVLNSLQQQTKILLTNIQISYQDFYAEQVKIVKTYPNMVARQLEYYKENICVFFKLQKVDMSQSKIVPAGEDTEEYNETVSHTDSVSSAVSSKPDDMNTPKSLDLSGDTPFSSEPNESSKAASKLSENEVSTRITPEKTTPTDNDRMEQVENDDNTSTSSKHLSAVESKVR